MNFPFDASWTLFLDRDGVINQRIMGGYVTSPKEFNFVDGAEEAIQIFRKYFQKVIVVTNQQCIAKKIISKRNLREIHCYMQQELLNAKTFVDGIYYAPELASDPHNTRKPKPYMAIEAQKDFPEIDFKKSVMVGDTDSDIQFGENLGMKTVLIKTEEITKKKAAWQFHSLHDFAKELDKND